MLCFGLNRFPQNHLAAELAVCLISTLSVRLSFSTVQVANSKSIRTFCCWQQLLENQADKTRRVKLQPRTNRLKCAKALWVQWYQSVQAIWAATQTKCSILHSISVANMTGSVDLPIKLHITENTDWRKFRKCYKVRLLPDLLCFEYLAIIVSSHNETNPLMKPEQRSWIQQQHLNNFSN